MNRLAYLACALLLTLSTASAAIVIFDPFTEPQLDGTTITSFMTGIGPAQRDLASSLGGTLTITGSGLVTTSSSGAPLLSYFFGFDSDNKDLTSYGAIFLRNVSAAGAPDIYVDIFDPDGIDSLLFTPSGPDYVADFSAVTQVDLTHVVGLGFRFAPSGPSMTISATSLELTTVPEPATVTLLGLGAAVFLLKRKKLSALKLI